MRLSIYVSSFLISSLSLTTLVSSTRSEKFLVSFKHGTDRSHNHILHYIDPSIQILDHIHINNFQAYVVQGQIDTIDVLSRQDGIKIYPNKKVSVAAYQSNAVWGLSRIASRNFTYSGIYTYPDDAGEGVDVYVVDTGVLVNHTEFEGRAEWGISTVENGTMRDIHGHGTHVAGTIGSKKYGVAKKANIIAVRVLGDKGDGDTVSVVSGLQWVLEQVKKRSRPAVVNMSLGSDVDEALDEAAKELVDAGIYVVAAAGNEYRDACDGSPARVRQVFTVGATDRMDQRAAFSNHGECVDIWAPGTMVISTSKDGETDVLSGTSMASPHVAGVIALVLSQGFEFKSVKEGLEFIQSRSTKNRVHGARGGFGGMIFNDVKAPVETKPPAFTPIKCRNANCLFKPGCDICE